MAQGQAQAGFSTPVTLLAANGAAREGTAAVTLRSRARRKTMAVVYAVGGLAVGIPTALIPILHLCTTWFLPLLGFLLASRSLKREFTVHGVAGTCPTCSQPVHLGKRETHPSAWQHCPKCGASFEVRVDDSTVKARG